MARRNPSPVESDASWGSLLADGAGSMGLSLSEIQVGQFRRYAQLLQRWGRTVNLTSRLEPREIISLHFLDSLSLLAVLAPEEGASVLDIGSGAGFPGIPLKIARPDLDVVLLEPSRRRAAFCSTVAGELGLGRLSVRTCRAEEASCGDLAGSRGWVVARGVTCLEDLLVLAVPFLAEGGRLVAYKGPDETPRPPGGNPGWRWEGTPLVAVPGRETPRALVVFRREPG